MSARDVSDPRSKDAVTRLLEDTWQARSESVNRRELLVELTAAALFLLCAVPLAAVTIATHNIDLPLAALLVVLYALTSRFLAFPIGAGNVVPTYVAFVPMLLLLPPGVAPLLVALARALAGLSSRAGARARAERALLAVPDAWHSLGPALVLIAAASVHGGISLALVYIAAFVAACLLDLLSATARERLGRGVQAHLQMRVIARVWLIDACVAPFGLLLAHAMQRNWSACLLAIPLGGVLVLASRDRSARIAEAQRRLDLVEHERTRLQTAVGRLGDALAAKLDLHSLTEILVRGSTEALDAEAGLLLLDGPNGCSALETGSAAQVRGHLRSAAEQAAGQDGVCQLQREDRWVLAVPFGFSCAGGEMRGAVAVARAERAFREDEQAVLSQLVQRGRQAASEIVANQLMRDAAVTDALTGLGNRRRLEDDLHRMMPGVSPANPVALVLFDLDGFKQYNDTFGHPAGDALLARLGGKLAAAVEPYGAAYRLGGDEFCVLMATGAEDVETATAVASSALEEHGESFAIGASFGAVMLPGEATDLEHAIQIADERMYCAKREGRSSARDQTRDVLIRIIHAKKPSLQVHSSEVAELCLRVGRRFGMSAEQLDELARAADLHDISKVGIPDAILEKPGPLDPAEWELMRRHTVLGERILRAAPALRPVALIVGAIQERWDGRGYPDGLAGANIPLAARIVAACDAYEAMTSQRSYRGARDSGGACEELQREAGRQFDPKVVQVLLSEARIYEAEVTAGQGGGGAGPAAVC